MKRQLAMAIGIGLCGLTGLTDTRSAWADSSPFLGTWHWNAAQSKLLPGEPVPGDMTANFARADSQHVRLSIVITDKQGRPTTQTFDAPANGEFYPISADTTVSFKLDDTTLQTVFKSSQGQSDTLTCALSADRQKMSCNGVMLGKDGKAQTYVDIYDRR